MVPLAGGESLLARGFVYLAVVLLPLVVAGLGFSRWLDADIEGRRERLVAQVAGEAGVVGQLADKWHQFQILGSETAALMRRQGPRAVQRLAQEAERRHPGLLRWIVWDGEGRILGGDHPAFVRGRRMAAGLVTLLGRGQGVAMPVLADARQLAASRRQALLSFAADFDLDRLADRPGELHTTWWMRQDAFVFWTPVWDVASTVFPARSWPGEAPASRRSAGGFLMVMQHDRAPEDLWLRRAVAQRPAPLPGLPHPLVLFDVEDPQQGMVSRELRRRSRVGRALRRAFLTRSGETFTAAGFVAMVSTKSTSRGWRLAVAADLAPLEALRARGLRRGLRGLALLAATVLGLVVFSPLRRWPARSLRLRIAGLFLLAILLPMVALLMAGQLLIGLRVGHERQVAVGAMRERVGALAMRFEEAPLILTRRLLESIEAALAVASHSPRLLQRQLHRLVRRGLAHQFYLSDADGRVALTADELRRRDPRLMPLVQLTLREVVRERRQRADAMAALANVMAEDAEALTGVKSDALTEAGRLREFGAGKSRIFIMRLLVTVAGEARGLLAELGNDDIERSFLVREFTRRGRGGLAGDVGVACEISFCAVPFEPYRCFPPENGPPFTQLQLEIWRAGNLNLRCEGEVTIDGEPFLYLVTKVPASRVTSPASWCRRCRSWPAPPSCGAGS